VRGLAALTILIYHFMPPHSDDPLTARLIHLAEIGWVGVDLFFVLSGFLITGILLDAKGTPNYFRNFYARRTLRIFPLYYGTLLAIFVAFPLAVRLAGLGPTLESRLGASSTRNSATSSGTRQASGSTCPTHPGSSTRRGGITS
jgi:peptidoglycan/LPS O-acetylase OafA/YrhL